MLPTFPHRGHPDGPEDSRYSCTPRRPSPSPSGSRTVWDGRGHGVRAAAPSGCPPRAPLPPVPRNSYAPPRSSHARPPGPCAPSTRRGWGVSGGGPHLAGTGLCSGRPRARRQHVGESRPLGGRQGPEKQPSVYPTPALGRKGIPWSEEDGSKPSETRAAHGPVKGAGKSCRKGTWACLVEHFPSTPLTRRIIMYT